MAVRKIIVCGGRNYSDRGRLWRELDKIHFELDFWAVATGAADGADWLAIEWAKARQVNFMGYPAEWDKHGKSAGPIRNIAMLYDRGLPMLVVAFPGGRGTADMVKKAKDAGVEVIEVDS